MSRPNLRRDHSYNPKHKLFYDDTLDSTEEKSIGIDLKQIGKLLAEIEKRKYRVALLRADLRLINNIGAKIEEKVKKPIEGGIKN
jgi:hypothetical protein